MISLTTNFTLNATDSVSPDCLPTGSVNEIEQIQIFGTSSIGIIKNLNKESEVKVIAPSKATPEITKSRRKITDIEELARLMNGAIESRWEEKLSKISQMLIKSLGFEQSFTVIPNSFDSDSGPACQADSDFYACGKLKLNNTHGDIICEVELLEDLESAKHFQAPKNISFPSYATTCNKINEEGEVLLSKRIFLDPNSNVEEEVLILKEALRQE